MTANGDHPGVGGMRTEHEPVKAARTAATAEPRQRWRAQAGVYLLVAFLAAGLFGALQPGTGLPTEVLQLTQFGPAVAVLTVALLWPARTGELLRGALPGRPAGGRRPGGRGRPAPGARFGGAAFPLVLLTAPVIIALSAGGYALAHGGAAFTDPRSLKEPFALIVAAQLLGACGEEIGWRCLFQPLLRTRFGPLPASALVGLAWAGWHVQAFAQGPVYAGGFLVATVSMSVVLGLAQERVRSNRLLTAGGFHTLVNLGMLLFTAEGSALAMVTLAGACLLTAVPWALRAPAATMTASAAHGAH